MVLPVLVGCSLCVKPWLLTQRSRSMIPAVSQVFSELLGRPVNAQAENLFLTA